MPAPTNFEQLYSSFLESRVCDELADDLQSIVRRAFLAGFQAAGGDPIQSDRIIELFPRWKPGSQS